MSQSYTVRKDIPLTAGHTLVLALTRDEEIALALIRRNASGAWENAGPAVIIEPTQVMDMVDDDDAVLTFGRITIERKEGMVVVRVDGKLGGKASAEALRAGAEGFLKKIA